MNQKAFVDQLDDGKIAAAVRAAEAKSTGEIRVFVSTLHCEDALAAAEKQFARLGMAKTKQRNGVLIFIAPKSQTFAVVGDEGIHQKVGEAGWSAVRDGMEARMKEGCFTEAIVGAVERVGEALARYFPCAGGAANCNELPDRVERDG